MPPPDRTEPSLLRSRSTAVSLLLAAALMGGLYAADSQHDPVADTSGVSAVVHEQMKALAAEDAGKAFALADSRLRTRFGNAEEFLDSVRSQYPMVLKPASVLFMQPQTTGSMAMQRVRLTDGEGYGWLVTYVLHREGRHWLIRNCVVEPDRPLVMA
jgi:Domain of unknown function (DUF4864)